jgi:hypothetical protein
MIANIINIRKRKKVSKNRNNENENNQDDNNLFLAVISVYN